MAHLFVGIDELGTGVSVSGVSGPAGTGLPDNVAAIDAQTLVINVRPDQDAVHLRISARGQDGSVTHWLVMVNTRSAEVSPSTGLGEEIASSIEDRHGDTDRRHPSAGGSGGGIGRALS